MEPVFYIHNYMFTWRNYIKCMLLPVSLQCIPVKPSTQTHSYPATRSLHFPLFWHGSLKQSFTAARRSDKSSKFVILYNAQAISHSYKSHHKIDNVFRKHLLIEHADLPGILIGICMDSLTTKRTATQMYSPSSAWVTSEICRVLLSVGGQEPLLVAFTVARLLMINKSMVWTSCPTCRSHVRVERP